MLLHHPDKALAGEGVSRDADSAPNGSRIGIDVDIVLLNEARAVLCDPVKRREWEVARYGMSADYLQYISYLILDVTAFDVS